MVFLPLVSEVNLARYAAVEISTGWEASEEALG
jgi:hypothetical protein